MKSDKWTWEEDQPQDQDPMPKWAIAPQRASWSPSSDDHDQEEKDPTKEEDGIEVAKDETEGGTT